VEGCEVDQIKRFKNDGFDYVVASQPGGREPFRDTLGLHGTNYTRETAYVRYYVLQRREKRSMRSGWQILSIDLIGTLADKYRNEPTDINFFALAGALAGLKAPLSSSNHEKDFRTYAQTVGFRETAELYEAISAQKGG
jgi:hypothetical protein